MNVDIPADAYKNIVCSGSEQLKMNARTLGFTAQFTTSVGPKYLGQNAAVYLYNEETGKLVFNKLYVVDKDGNITFDVIGGGRYFFALGRDVKAPTELRGDANGDGVVNCHDAAAILKNIVDGTATDISADANSDGAVNALDAAAILRYIVGGAVELPVCE